MKVYDKRVIISAILRSVIEKDDELNRPTFVVHDAFMGCATREQLKDIIGVRHKFLTSLNGNVVYSAAMSVL